MNAVELGPVPAERRTQPALDLFLIFAGANVVATTLVTGASLAPAFGTAEAHRLVTAGSLAGAGLVAALATLGPRLGVPSVVAARAALGVRGGALLAGLLYLTNFAWIALNNVIAASVCASLTGGPATERLWAVTLGLLATAVVAGGPRAVGAADRMAVPAMVAVGIVMTAACLALPREVLVGAGSGGSSWFRGLDVVIGYQVSWILMFADYSRYTPSASRSAVAVFLGLALTSAWFMPLGFLAARAAGSAEPGAMVAALGLGGWGAALLALGTLTTNFVNVYLSALSWKSLFPRTGDRASIWSIGIVGAALSLLSRAWIERYAEFMLLLGGLLVPVGGILLARFFLSPRPVDVAALYGEPGRGIPAFSAAGLAAWAAGAGAYFLSSSLGGTLPSLVTAVLVFAAVDRVASASGARAAAS